MKKPHNIPVTHIDHARCDALSFFGVGYYGFDFTGNLLFMDECAFRLLGLDYAFSTPDALMAKSLDEIIGVGVHKDMAAYLQQHPCMYGYEWQLTTHVGEERTFLVDARIIAQEQSSIQGLPAPCIECIVRDITMLKGKNGEYPSGQYKYQRILETIKEGYYETDLKGNLTFFNGALANILGETVEKLRGHAVAELYPDPATQDEMRKTYKKLRYGGGDVVVEWPLMRRDGKRRMVEVSISLMTAADGKPCGFRGLVRDVTDRADAEQAFRLAETRYNDLLEEANDIIYTHDFDGRFILLNKAGEQVSGYTREEVYCMNVADIIAPEHRAQAREFLRRRLQGEQVGRYELEIIAKDGRHVPLEVNARLMVHNGRPVAVQGIARDITDRRRAEEQRRHLERQILHTQKLEGLGVLASGIAHDFNNLLVGILGNASLAVRRLPKNSPGITFMKRIENAAQRAAELTNQMLAYSGRGAFIVRPVYLDRLAREIADLARAGIPKKVRLQFDFEGSLPPILGDVAQMHQVVMNLVTNAAEAIGDNVGVITISAQQVTLDADYLARVYFHAEASPGVFVCLAVGDTGCGMNEEQKARMFDPFYSTKFSRRGLGLAALLGIVRGHMGAVNVYSEPGHGTLFKLFFPAIESGASEEGGALPDIKESEEAELRKWKADGLVLVADDEEAVRIFACEVLRRLGMTVVTAYDGKEALALFEKHRNDLRLALIDLMMPFVNGQEVFEHCRATRPELPVIISSGYSGAEIHDRFRENQPDHFIQKPYRALDLVRAVKSVLDNERAIKS